MQLNPLTDISYDVAIRELVDYLLPELTPIEATMYLFLLRHTILDSGKTSVRIGKRSIAARFAKGARGERSNIDHITSILKKLEGKGCLKIGDTTREGILYTIIPPREIPIVVEKLAISIPTFDDNDYFSTEEKRKIIFERDKWTCQYCGDKVVADNATLDHFSPRSKGGDNSKENLRTACLLCNSLKSGKTFEEAAPLILSSIRDRRVRTENRSS